jgi:long-chain fatty acid transport protein
MLSWLGMLIFSSLGKAAGHGNSMCWALVVAAALLGCWTSGVSAAGFALVQQGTAAMGQGNAFVAEANDASAIYYNPAGISQIKRAQVYQGSFFNFPDRDYSGGGQDSQTNHRMYRSLTAYVTIPVHDRVTLGLGFFSPFGMGTVWPPTWAGRYLTTYSSLKTYCLNPVVSVKVLDNLSLAAGFDVLWSQVDLKRKTPVVLRGRPFPDGEIRLIGDGNGLGYNLGVHYEPLSGVKLGVAYRSKVEVNHYGSLNTTLPVPLPGPNSDGDASIVFPPSLTMGIAYSRLKPFTFEFDTTWTGWSTYDQLKVNLDTPVPVNGVMTNTIITPKNWHNSWAFRFGANYAVNETMKLRAGYIYDLTPVPDGTFDPQVPDANRHIFTVGSDLKVFERFTLGFAYNYILSEGRTKSNSVVVNGVPAPLQANGRYNSDVHSVGLSWSFQF